MTLRELYQEMIIDHGKTPRNFGKLREANCSQVGYNPLCGDQLTLYIYRQQDKVTEVSFEGKGCAISVASASLMTESIKGKSVEDIEKLFEQFHQLLTSSGKSDVDLGKLQVFAGVSEFPIRIKCATLAWHTLKAALHGHLNPVSTE